MSPRCLPIVAIHDIEPQGNEAALVEYVVSEGRIAHLENSRDFMVAWTSAFRHL
jgi:hypothetical protein